MDVSLARTIETLILPPGGPLLLSLPGAALLRPRPRAAESFERARPAVTPAPTCFAEAVPFPRNWLPEVQSGLLQTRLALHEWLGRVVYAVQAGL